MFNFYRITKNAFTESLREPIFFVMLLTALAIIGNLPGLTLFVFWEQIKMVLDSALATTLVLGLIVVALTASNTLGRELRNGTVLMLFSKPVSRWTFILAKLAGAILTGLLFSGMCCLSAMIALYIATDEFRINMMLYGVHLGLICAGCGFGLVSNYLRGVNICEYSVRGILALQIAMLIFCRAFEPHPAISLINSGYAMILVMMSVSIMSTLAVLFSTRFDAVPTLMLCFVMFFLGLVSNYIFGNPGDNLVVQFLCGFFYSILPNWQYFWMVDPVALNRSIPVSYMLSAFAYAGLYIAICSIWAIALFASREVARDSR